MLDLLHVLDVPDKENQHAKPPPDSLAGIGKCRPSVRGSACQCASSVITGKKIPEGYEPIQTVVKIGDLNLATPSGVDAMEKRVAKAINSLCQATPPIRDEKERVSKACREYPWASARPQVDRVVRKARGS